MRFVRNGEELFDYLRCAGEYEDPRSAPLPEVILLDLKMPRKDGREALRELKGDRNLRLIPVVVLTTSTAAADIEFCYRVGVKRLRHQAIYVPRVGQGVGGDHTILVRGGGIAAKDAAKQQAFRGFRRNVGQVFRT